MGKESCVFCRKFQRNDGEVLIFKPLNPVTPGHLLVVPREHVPDFTQKPNVTAEVMAAAADKAKNMGDVNLIASKGAAATQSVFHMHVHLVPRSPNDGLKLPWTGQEIKESS